MMRLFLIAALCYLSLPMMAQTRQVKGVVQDSTGLPLIGATVRVQGATTGTIADEEGRFSLAAPAGNFTLEISSAGFVTKKISAGANDATFTIIMESDVRQLEGVVVTALGITRKARSLTYSMQSVSGSDLTTVKNTNVLNSLNGKVAGVQVNRTSGGAGGSVRMVLRGDKSTRNSQPLYVIDGLPVINQTGGPDAGLYNNAPDAGDIMSTLNPDDIESINLLKGASASALYGSQGSNGVVLITTKKGKNGVSRIDFSSSMTVDQVNVLPSLQHKYNQTTAPTATSPGSDDSWGASGATQPGKDYVKDFFQTGLTFINSLSLQTGNERSSNYLSYSNTDNKGVLPTSTYNQHTLNFRQSSKLLNDRLIFDGTFMGSMQKAHNRLTPGVYFNPLTGLYLFPRGQNFDNYKQYEYFSSARYLNAQNWWNINYDKDVANGGGWGGQDYQQNPYWTLYRNPADNRNQNVYGAVSLKYLLNDWLTLQTRGNISYFLNEYERRMYATTQSTLARANGNLFTSRSSNRTLYGDLLLTGERSLGSNWGIGFTAGTSIQDQQAKTMTVAGSPTVPNVFLESALDKSNIDIRNTTTGSPTANRRLQSVFGSVQFNYKEMVYLDLADRHDWSSTLAFTPTEKKGYNYYSVGLSAILNEMLRLPAVINMAKLRVSYAEVGNDIAANSTYPLYTFSVGGVSNPPTSQPAPDSLGLGLKPERNKSVEIGTQWNLFNNRLSVDITWYKSNIIHQYFSGVDLLIGTSTKGDINAGNIQNTGIEASASYQVFKNSRFSWTTTANFSRNRNKIVELFDPSVVKGASAASIYKLTSSGEYTAMRLNGTFGDFYGRTFQRDPQGKVIVNSTTHLPVLIDSLFGNPNPKFILGWNNTFSIGNIYIGMLIDGKFGGKVFSVTEGYLDQMGVSERTGEARDNGGTVGISNAVDETGHAWSGTVDAQTYYKHIGGKTPAGSAYTYDATAIRLRELSVSWKLPLNGNAVKDLRIGLIGNNLFFFKREAPFDPEQVAGVNAGGVGIDAFGLPATRSIGVNLKCSF